MTRDQIARGLYNIKDIKSIKKYQILLMNTTDIPLGEKAKKNKKRTREKKNKR